MKKDGHTRPSANSIPLNPQLVRDRTDLKSDILQIVRSVRYELLDQNRAIRLLGPDTSYHRVDPYLRDVLRDFDKNSAVVDICSYRSSRNLFDLCLEDSWSGYFIADHLRCLAPQEDIVLIHLDDHTDMMPTLLARHGDDLMDLAAGRTFDPARREDWETAIRSGSVSIGNFLTPLYYSANNVHVLHLNNSPDSGYQPQYVSRESRRYDLIPTEVFAGVEKRGPGTGGHAGTYVGGADAASLLRSVPPGRVLVHIDLDYFINDFNGNVGQHREIADSDLVFAAWQKMNAFFDALNTFVPSVERWIIATSPGFCSARHWRWLLRELEVRIEA